MGWALEMEKSLLAAFAIGLMLFSTSCGAEEKKQLREAAVAGKFYPADPAKLTAAIKGYLQDAVTTSGQRPIAIVSPHAGYIFSGQIAADAFKQAEGFPVEVAVILGTNHTVPQFDGVSVYCGAGYKTPLGTAEVDQKLAAQLAGSDPSFKYRPDAHEKEHSEEVQVPFVQVLFPKAKIVTAVIGSSDPGLAERFGLALARALKGRKALIVASSDLSHYPDYATACEVDGKTLAAVASMEEKAISKAISGQESAGKRGLSTCACGEAPILAAVSAAKALGARGGTVLSYANSGDTVAGEDDRVVGYGAVMFSETPAREAKSPPPVRPPGQPGQLDEAGKEYLLALARKTVERFMTSETAPLPRPGNPALMAKQGAFVTLKKFGELRGCIGHMAEDSPLALTVARMALEAAFNDGRFNQVQQSEIPSLEFEISVLTPLKRVSGPEAVVVGRDGVAIQKGGRSAVYLPQVAPEQGWGLDEMLGHLCEKAGMTSDCWRSGCEFRTFQAIVFHEKGRK